MRHMLIPAILLLVGCAIAPPDKSPFQTEDSRV